MASPISHEDFVTLANEQQPEHWFVNEDMDLSEADQLVELLQTGSVTTMVNGVSYEMTLIITKV